MATFFSGVTIGWWYTSTNYMKATLTGDVSRSGNTVTLTNMVLSITGTTTGTGFDSYWFTVNGTQTNFTIRPNGYDYGAFSLNNTSFAVTSEQTSANIGWSSKDGYSGSFTVTFPASGTPPSTPVVVIEEIYPDGAKFNVSIDSYGVPSSESGRYIEADIFGTSTFGAPYRYAVSFESMASSITVDSENGGSSPASFVVSPNTQYYYGGYTSNTVLGAQVVTGSFVTTAPAATIALGDVTETSATIAYSCPADGGYYGKTIEYSLDGGSTWQTAATISGGSAVSGTFTISGLTSGTTYSLLSRVTTNSGSTSNGPLSFTTISVAVLYGSVNGQAKRVVKLYGSVNGGAKRITKLYGSVNGIAKRIY